MRYCIDSVSRNCIDCFRANENPRQAKVSLKHKKIAHPFILVFITAASIFIAEALVMMVLPSIKGISPVYEGTIDALLLTVLVFPVLYLFLFRPMISVIRSLSEAEDELQMANEELEARVAIRTSELAWANDSLKKEMEERVKIEGDLRDSEKRYRCLWEDMNDAAFLADAETGRITDANRSAEMLLMRTREEIIGMHQSGLHPEGKSMEYRRIFREYKEIPRGNIDDMEVVRKDGRVVPVTISSAPVTIAGRQFLIGLFRDMTERKRLEEELRRTAMTDRLTGAFNRLKFDEIMAIELNRARRYKRPLTLSIFDIDDFKRINDTFGHAVGDIVLVELAKIVKSMVRESSYLFRWGGEEFVILLPEISVEGAAVQAERIRKEVETHAFAVAGRVTVSFGMAEFRRDDTADSIVKRADEALYRAKERGKNRVEGENVNAGLVSEA